MPSNPPHAHVEYLGIPSAAQLLRLPALLPLHEGQQTAWPLAFKNVGEFAVNHPSDAGLVILVPSAKVGTTFQNIYKGLKFFDSGGSIPAHSADVAYHTYASPSGKIRRTKTHRMPENVTPRCRGQTKSANAGAESNYQTMVSCHCEVPIRRAQLEFRSSPKYTVVTLSQV